MFTVKYIDENGVENISEHLVVVADYVDHGRRVLVFDEVPSSHLDNSAGIYVQQPMVAGSALAARKLYVMNRFGATVASYSL